MVIIVWSKYNSPVQSTEFTYLVSWPNHMLSLDDYTLMTGLSIELRTFTKGIFTSTGGAIKIIKNYRTSLKLTDSTERI